MNQWTKNPVSLRDRFYAKFQPIPESGCWIWDACGSAHGRYGYIHVGDRNRPAHRVSWEIHRGPIPDGLEVCHKCDVEACVNPAHLFLGTHKDNCMDRDSKGRNVSHPGSRHGNSKLVEADILAIRASEETALALAKRYGVHESSIGYIRQRKTWRHV